MLVLVTDTLDGDFPNLLMAAGFTIPAGARASVGGWRGYSDSTRTQYADLKVTTWASTASYTQFTFPPTPAQFVGAFGLWWPPPAGGGSSSQSQTPPPSQIACTAACAKGMYLSPASPTSLATAAAPPPPFCTPCPAKSSSRYGSNDVTECVAVAGYTGIAGASHVDLQDDQWRDMQGAGKLDFSQDFEVGLRFALGTASVAELPDNDYGSLFQVSGFDGAGAFIHHDVYHNSSGMQGVNLQWPVGGTLRVLRSPFPAGFDPTAEHAYAFGRQGSALYVRLDGAEAAVLDVGGAAGQATPDLVRFGGHISNGIYQSLVGRLSSVRVSAPPGAEAWTLAAGSEPAPPVRALTICPAGTFKEDESAAACESCPSLSYSPAGSTSPADCKCNAGLT